MPVDVRPPCLAHRTIFARGGTCNIREMTYRRKGECEYVSQPMSGFPRWFMLSEAIGAPRTDSQIRKDTS
jgi:hypothetical protein